MTNAKYGTRSGRGAAVGMDNLERRFLLAGQIITTPVNPIVVSAGAAIAVPLQYNTSDGNNHVSGLGLRIHYNSSRLSWNSLGNVFAMGLISQDSTPQDDTANLDGDASTDKYIAIRWADLLSSSWPGTTLPQQLAVANFTVAAGLSRGDSTDVRFSEIEAAAGYTLQATPAHVVVGGPLAITGTAGADTILLALSGGDVRVTLNGDVSYYNAASVTSISVASGDGNDTITIGTGVMACTIDGGLGDDSITGGDGGDSIRGDAGNDTIFGGAGNDSIMGNTGDDRLYAGDGDDQIQAGLGADSLEGGLGNDHLYGGDQSDTILGQEGDDYIEGRGKMDTIYGGAGNDTIYGGAGSDLICGDDGNDLIDVGVSAVFHDTVDGGTGSDLIRSDSDDVLANCEGVWPV